MLSKERFVELLAGCERTLYCVSRSILRSDADCADAVQEAIARAWAARATFRDEAKFRAWMTRILINECHNLQRKRRRISLVAEPEVRGQTPGPDTQPLHEALAALDEGLRLTVTLHYLEGFGVEEIAAMQKIPSGTVKWRLSKARKLLRELLTDEGVRS